MNVFCAWIKHLHSGKFRGQKRFGPLKISFEMALKVILPQKKISRGTLIVIIICCPARPLILWIGLVVSLIMSIYIFFQDPAKRPTMKEIVSRLDDLQDWKVE
jgi:hypothetical protein